MSDISGMMGGRRSVAGLIAQVKLENSPKGSCFLTKKPCPKPRPTGSS